jgi:uncharacterized protein
MNIFITGATGFIGRALTLRLRRDGHEVVAYVRDKKRAASQLGMEVSFLETKSGPEALRSAMDKADAVVNLAGDPLLGGRWNEEKIASIKSSRLDLTRDLVSAMSKENPPKVLVSSSAVGLYGDGGDAILNEESPSGDDFLATLCRDWESEALNARDKGVRVARIRTGVVLGRGGGALEQMLPAFSFGVGGPIGSGDQYVPWIHIEDLVELITKAIDDETMSGAFNGTAPNPVTFSELASAIGKQLSRPSFLPIPSFAVKMLFGDASVVLLQGQRAIPAHAQAKGFKFQYQTISEALKDILENDSIEVKSIEGALPDSDYIKKRKPAFVLETSTVIKRPLEEVFPFFSRPENLGVITPPAMQFRITNLPETMEDGALIDYKLKVGIVPIRWQTRIENWIPGEKFVDSQLKGPYHSWWHEHSFEARGNETVMTDRVYYAPPAGPIGKMVNALFIADQLKQVFGYRASILRLRFGNG